MITESDINSAYNTLIEVQVDHNKAGIASIEAKNKLKNNIAELAAQGIIQGKNDFEREASIWTNLKAQVEDSQKKQLVLEQADLDLEIAKLEVERVRALLRLAEIESILE